MNYENITPKHLMVFSAIMDILKIFADSEIGGQYEFDYEVIASYIDSYKMATDYFYCKTKDDFYNRFTEDIYNGFPVWRMLKLPKWTYDMVEKTFKSDCEAEFEAYKKQYKCFTCKHYRQKQTDIGVLMSCNFEDSKTSLKSTTGREPHSCNRKEPFRLQEQCNNYVAIT